MNEPTARDRERSPTELRAIIEEYDDERDECTVFPDDLDGGKNTTVWISAKSGSFVSLAERR